MKHDRSGQNEFDGWLRYEEGVENLVRPYYIVRASAALHDRRESYSAIKRSRRANGYPGNI